ncbi:MAG: tripartite tricarboxylate transporter TctB family protein [Candidatus Limnocylindria bacterium]
MTDEGHAGPGRRVSTTGPRLVGVALLALGLVVLYGTFQIARGAGYSAVGPAAIPLAVAVILIGVAGLFILRTTVRPDADLLELAAAEESATHWPTVGLMVLTLVGYAFALGPLGYITATSLFLPIGARILGSRQPLRDLAIGIGLSVVIYFAFTEALGLRLPAGILEFIL